jgi:hypothetical protein
MVFVSHPTRESQLQERNIYYEYFSAFRAWELISHFQFEFLMHSKDANIVITFAPPNHRLFE